MSPSTQTICSGIIGANARRTYKAATISDTTDSTPVLLTGQVTNQIVQSRGCLRQSERAGPVLHITYSNSIGGDAILEPPCLLYIGRSRLDLLGSRSLLLFRAKQATKENQSLATSLSI
jgi:hypothetical protein